MPLSIRNLKTEQLARDLAAETGENMTEAITRALEERMQRLCGRRMAVDLVADIMSVSRRCRDLPDQDTRSPDEILGYDQHGMPA